MRSVTLVKLRTRANAALSDCPPSYPGRGQGPRRAETEVLAVAELPQIAVLETIVRVACERDCCAGLVAARAPLVTAQAER